MSASYHNTTNSSGDELLRYDAKAKSQEGKILHWLEEGAGLGLKGPYAPSMIRKLCFANQVPLTSVRRALSNLTEARQLVKTDTQKRGPYGRPEHTWRLPKQPIQKSLF